MIVGVIRRKPVLTHASIICEGMLASVNSVKNVNLNISYYCEKFYMEYIGNSQIK